jgi:hypothetical protein
MRAATLASTCYLCGARVCFRRLKELLWRVGKKEARKKKTCITVINNTYYVDGEIYDVSSLSNNLYYTILIFIS